MVGHGSLGLCVEKSFTGVQGPAPTGSGELAVHNSYQLLTEQRPTQVNHDGSAYTTDTGKCYTLGLSLPHLHPKSKLFSIGHRTAHCKTRGKEDHKLLQQLAKTPEEDVEE